MAEKFFDQFNKTDWTKIGILIVVAIIAWTWVYIEYQKPILPPEWQEELQIQQ